MAQTGLNKIMLLGKLSIDPELTYIDQNVAMARLWVVCTDEALDRSGKKKSRTDWIEVVLWREVAELAHKNCRKGSNILIEGRLKSHRWKSPEGILHSRLEVEGEHVRILPEDRGSESPGFKTPQAAGINPLEKLNPPDNF